MTNRNGINKVITGAVAAGVLTLTSLLAGVAHAEEPVYALIGTPPTEATVGDGDSDGRDFLMWQRNVGPPSSVSSGDLADWQANYGAGY